jgi:hypothetical protein
MTTGLVMAIFRLSATLQWMLGLEFQASLTNAYSEDLACGVVFRLQACILEKSVWQRVTHSLSLPAD